jgi:hypothetical protein
MRRATLLISLPFILSANILFGMQSQAMATELPAEQATELLAKSQALDAKCKFLSNAERDDLASFVARAELSLAQRESVALTKQALARGYKAGNSATCSAAEHTDILNILVAARTAVAQAPHVMIQPKKIRTSTKVETAPHNVSPPQSNASLASYAKMTQTYYLARRCGSMSPRAISNFYRTIVRTHNKVLSSFGRAAVASVMQQSESKAGTQRCS